MGVGVLVGCGVELSSDGGGRWKGRVFVLKFIFYLFFVWRGLVKVFGCIELVYLWGWV